METWAVAATSLSLACFIAYAAIVGMAAKWLRRNRPKWSTRRIICSAALPAPALLTLCTGAFVAMPLIAEPNLSEPDVRFLSGIVNLAFGICGTLLLAILGLAGAYLRSEPMRQGAAGGIT